MESLDSVLDDLLYSVDYNFLLFWAVLSATLDWRGGELTPERMEDVLDLITEMLDTGWMVAGEINSAAPDGYGPWIGSTTDIVERIRQRWREIGWDKAWKEPCLPCTFHITPAGRHEASLRFYHGSPARYWIKTPPK